MKSNKAFAIGLVVVAVLAAGCGNGRRQQAALQPAAAAAPDVLERAYTDNYKWYFDDDPKREYDERTSLLFSAVNIGGQRYTTTQPGTTLGDEVFLPNGLPLKSASGAVAYLKPSERPPAARYDTGFRVFLDGTFGIMNGTRDKRTFPNDPITFPSTSLPFTLTIADGAGATLGQVKLEYKYDQQIATQGDTSLEYKGPGGRWFVDAKTTPLNWPAKINVALPANAVVGTPVQMQITAVDLAGLTVASYKDHAVQFTSTPAGGATLPGPYTLTAADNGTKTLPVTFNTEASHTITGTTTHTTYPKAFTSSGTSAPVTVTKAGQPTGTADVAISSVAATPSSPWVGNRLTSVVTVKNLTADKTATGVKLTASVPSDMKVVSATKASGTCNIATGCDLGNLAGGAATTVTLITTPTQSGAKTISYKVASTSTDPTSANNANASTRTIKGVSCTAVGTEGNDVITGTTGDDVLCGLGGADTINGGTGNDIVYGGEGNDKLAGGDGNDAILGGAGDDSIDGGVGTDRISVEDGLDGVVVNLTTHDIFCNSDAAGKLLPCGLGYDSGIANIEQATGSPYADIIYGGAGNDTLTGGAGNDQIYGQAGNDSIAGQTGVDNLNGGTGNDTISLGSGTENDTVNGNEGVNTVTYFDATAKVTINLGTGKATGQGTDTLTNIQNANGSGYDDTITGKSGVANVIKGLGGEDTIYVKDSGKDTIDGGAGTDRAQYDKGVDVTTSIETTLT